MERYRLYLIEARDGHIYGARDIEAADDDAALRISAREQRRPAELWAGPRRIAIFGQVPGSAQPGEQALA